MHSARRIVPTAYKPLVDALANGLFPAERAWIDFKREFYPPVWPTDPQKAKQLKDKKHNDLAADMAAMAVHGGWLVFGVEEDKKLKTFTPYPMDLIAGLREIIDALARDRATPPLYVDISEVPDPDDPGRGFVVIEIPESPDAPHQVDGIYWGRSDTGNIRLSDEQIERLMIQRGRRNERLISAMQATMYADPIPGAERDITHAYFTAIPTRGRTDMFARFTRDTQAHQDLAGFCRKAASVVRAATVATAAGQVEVAYDGMMGYHRSSRTNGAWLTSHATGAPAQEGVDRWVGIADDGEVRLIECGAGSTNSGLSVLWERAIASGAPDNAPRVVGRVVFQELIRMRVVDMLHLVTALSAEVGYPGSWMLGLQVDRLKGHAGALPHRYPLSSLAVFDDDEFRTLTTATRTQMTDDPEGLAAQLLRRLYRGLGLEHTLPAGRCGTP